MSEYPVLTDEEYKHMSASEAETRLDSFFSAFVKFLVRMHVKDEDKKWGRVDLNMARYWHWSAEHSVTASWR